MKITLSMFLLFLIGYFIGVLYPSIGTNTIAKVNPGS